MWISRDKFGTRLTPDKPIWSGDYFIRQERRETTVADELHNLEIGETRQVKWINTIELNIMSERTIDKIEELRQDFADYKINAERELDSLERKYQDERDNRMKSDEN